MRRAILFLDAKRAYILSFPWLTLRVNKPAALVLPARMICDAERAEAILCLIIQPVVKALWGVETEFKSRLPPNDDGT